MQKSINTSRGRLLLTTGTEGPSWDLYGYREITWELPEGCAVYHGGLIENTTFQGLSMDGDAAATIFQQITGYYPGELELWLYKARTRCQKCGCRKLHGADGYPGEHFMVCNQCNEVVDYTFCESEIV